MTTPFCLLAALGVACSSEGATSGADASTDASQDVAAHQDGTTPPPSPDAGDIDSPDDAAAADGAAHDSAILESSAGDAPGEAASVDATSDAPVDATDDGPAMVEAGDSGAMDSSDASADVGCVVAMPTFTPAGGPVVVGQDVTISTSTVLPGVRIYFTTDGTLPDHGSHVYNGPLVITPADTFPFRAIASAPGCADSPVGSASYVIEHPDAGPLATPMPTPAPGDYHGDFVITLSTPSGASAICYSLDGVTTPACGANGFCTAGTTYAGAGIVINPTVVNAQGYVTLLAIACAPGTMSSVAGPWTYRLL